jgi:hypothetical protein
MQFTRLRGHLIGAMALAIVHVPATLIRSAPGAPWARIEGFATADELFAELPDHTDPRAVR